MTNKEVDTSQHLATENILEWRIFLVVALVADNSRPMTRSGRIIPGTCTARQLPESGNLRSYDNAFANHKALAPVFAAVEIGSIRVITESGGN